MAVTMAMPVAVSVAMSVSVTVAVAVAVGARLVTRRPRLVSRRPRIVTRSPRLMAGGASVMPRRGHAFTASRRGGRVTRGSMSHPILGRLLPVGGLRVQRHLHRLVAGHGRREEVRLARRGRERRHVGRLGGGRVRGVDVGGAGRVCGRVEGGRMRGRRVVGRGGKAAVRGAQGGRALHRGARGRRVAEVLLEPLQEPAQRVEHPLPELVPVGHHRHVLVRAPRARQVGEQEPPGVVLGGGYHVVDFVWILGLLLLEPLFRLVPHATERLVIFIGD